MGIRGIYGLASVVRRELAILRKKLIFKKKRK